MKIKINYFGLVALAVLFAITIIGCDSNIQSDEQKANTDSALNGSWICNFGTGGMYEIIYNNGNAETLINNCPGQKWTYVTNNGSYSSSLTQVYGSAYGLEARWYSREEFQASSNSGLVMDLITDYSINGDSLTLINYYTNGTYLNTLTYTRK